MDATRCISYLTIEHRGEIAPELQPLMGEWLYGCDICQDVCPYNQGTPLASDPAYRPSPEDPLVRFTIDKTLSMTQEQHDAATRGSAMRRASLVMLKRNAEICRRNLLEARARPGGSIASTCD